jgi:short-subunit dehydrogenase
MKNKLALITGASSGIGWQLALQLASRGYDLLIVARREERLQQLAEQITKHSQTQVLVLGCDLSNTDAVDIIDNFLQQRSLQVNVLVNNAGLGDNRLFSEASAERIQQMLQVNVDTLVKLTYRLLPQLLAQPSSYILNVASTAALQPIPYMAVYAASKAFVLSFSEALYAEYKTLGVQVTTLCPGPTSTEFSSIARLQDSELFNSKALGVLSAEFVARCGVKALFANKRRVIPGWRQKFLAWLSWFSPSGVNLAMTKKFTQP